MTPTSLLPRFTKPLVAAAVLTAALTSQAGAVSLTVKLACANDYYAHCSQHSPGSIGVRKCMRAHGSQLSNQCINALIGAGEVSKAEVERRRAARAGKAKEVAAN
jgi:hypothetical protein